MDFSEIFENEKKSDKREQSTIAMKSKNYEYFDDININNKKSFLKEFLLNKNPRFHTRRKQHRRPHEEVGNTGMRSHRHDAMSQFGTFRHVGNLKLPSAQLHQPYPKPLH